MQFYDQNIFLLEGHIFPTEVNPAVSITKIFLERRAATR